MIVLGLGSNIEKENNTREETLICALRLLDETDEITVEKVSQLYQTQPLGFTKQPDFLNCAASVITNLSPSGLLEACLNIERQMGRVRDIRWGPRNIDIDLLFYDDLIINEENLELPHPRMTERRFVLVPLLDIAEDFPVYKGMTTQELLDLTVDKSTVKKYKSPVFENFLKSFMAR